MCDCKLNSELMIELCSVHKAYCSFEELRFTSKIMNDSDCNYYFNRKSTNTLSQLNEDSEIIKRVSINNEVKCLKCSNHSSESKDEMQYSNIRDKSDISLVQLNHKRRIYHNNDRPYHIIKFHHWTNSNIELDVRYDTMNKNFARAVKREYKRIFDEYLKSNDLGNSKYSLIENTRQFAQYLLDNTSVKWRKIIDFDRNIFITYLMSLTHYCKFKSLELNDDEKKIKEEIYSLLYSFTHIRFYNFIYGPEVRVLIIILKEILGMTSLLKATTKSKYSVYRVHISKLLNSLKIK